MKKIIFILSLIAGTLLLQGCCCEFWDDGPGYYSYGHVHAVPPPPPPRHHHHYYW